MNTGTQASTIVKEFEITNSMMTYTRTMMCCLLFICTANAQDREIPEWFMNDLNMNVGVWQAENSQYMSDGEPFSHYVMEWTWGIGKTSIIGRLYGIKNGEPTTDFWQFRQYWDNENQKAILQQFGFNGVTGYGTISASGKNTTETIQTFSLPDGRTWEERHLSEMDMDHHITTSFDKNEEGDWQEKRTYRWERQSEKK
jgi:hypothetical protein